MEPDHSESGPSRLNVRYAEIYGVEPCGRLWPALSHSLRTGCSRAVSGQQVNFHSGYQCAESLQVREASAARRHYRRSSPLLPYCWRFLAPLTAQLA